MKPSPDSKLQSPQHPTLWKVAVWTLRLLTGGVFVMSGLVKLIDLWGFVYKIEEYLGVWGIEEPRSLVFVLSFLISGSEFVLGSLLALGCYRRSAPWLLLCMMAVMLPLTLYIYIDNPVADCGCFGDFWKISNGATFWKNVAITAALVLLIIYNGKTDGLFRPPTQWLVVTVLGVYSLVVGLVGYYIQPMVDFRSFPPGSSLVSWARAGIDTEISRPRTDDGTDSTEDRSTGVDEGEEEPDFVFIYENEAGLRKEFTIDNLPDEGWTFVDRKQVTGEKSDGFEPTEFVVLDGNNDVTSEVVTGSGVEVLLLIPDINKADVAYTYPLNELNDYLKANNGRMAALIVSGEEGLDVWRDLSMASYPLYQAEPNLVKELARGDMSLVFLNDGKIIWKRALTDPDRLSMVATVSPDPVTALDEYDPLLSERLAELTLLLFGVLSVLWLLDRSGYRIYLIGSRKRAEG